MPFVPRQEMACGPGVPCLPAGLNRWGDLVCPFCHLNMCMPGGAMLVPGPGRCPACRRLFTVFPEIAARANACAYG